MDLQFDSKGYLTPYHIHSIDKDTLQDIFVTNVGRKEIYLCYLQVIESLINIVGGGFYVWYKQLKIICIVFMQVVNLFD